MGGVGWGELQLHTTDCTDHCADTHGYCHCKYLGELRADALAVPLFHCSCRIRVHPPVVRVIRGMLLQLATVIVETQAV